MFFLIFIYQNAQNFQFISLFRAWFGIKDFFDTIQCFFIIFFGMYGLDLHNYGSALNCRCIYFVVFSMCTYKTDEYLSIVIINFDRSEERRVGIGCKCVGE